jgi:hypothetical protein
MPQVCKRLVIAILASPILMNAATAAVHGKLRVSENHRNLQFEDGTTFFYLADTAWELFHRLNREDASRYLANRSQKGFNVIQAVILAELEGLTVPNAYGDLPLAGGDITRPNEDYFRHVDFIVDQAEALGLFMGILPTWADIGRRRTLFFRTLNPRASTGDSWALDTRINPSSGYWEVTGPSTIQKNGPPSRRWRRDCGRATVATI